MFKRIKMWLMKYNRKREAKKYGVPFRERKWYNLRAMLSKEDLNNHSFIEIFDEKGNYINCPKVGGEVVYYHRGQRFLYKVVGFKNASRNSDWLYDSDYIHPIIEYVEKIKD